MSSLSSVCSSCFSTSSTVRLPFSHLPPHLSPRLSLKLSAEYETMYLQCWLQRLELALSNIGDFSLGLSVVFWCGGCWFNLCSSLGVRRDQVAVKTTTSVQTTHQICRTKVRGFISREICPRKEEVANSPREAFSKCVPDRWPFRSPDCLAKEQWDAVGKIKVHSQTELDFSSRLSYPPTNGQVSPSFAGVWGG